MRLFLKESGTEITGVKFNSVRKVMTTGGSFDCQIRDATLGSVRSNFSNNMERVEVRKNDGSTVIWEGIIDKLSQRSQPSWEFQISGKEGLYFLDKIPCNYSSIKRAGVVTGLAGAVIADANAAFSNLLLTKPCYFSGDHEGETSEIILPDAASDFVHNGGDNPADTETKTSAGDESDLIDAGWSRYWEISDTSNRGKDFYGIGLDFDVTNSATAQRLVINFVCEFEPASMYTTAANSPVIEIWDQTNTSWEDDDTLNAGNIVGVGRTGHYSTTTYNTVASKTIGKIEITDNCERYFNGTVLKMRVMCGTATGTGNTKEKVRVMSGMLTNVYGGNFDIAGSTTYIIDARTSTTLTFTGQTPDSDGVDEGSSYTIGDFFHVNMSNIWRYSQMVWLDLDFDTTTIGEGADYRGMFIGNVLDDFAERLNWNVWQAIGWVIKVYGTYTDTALSLTEDNFLDWNHTIHNKNTFSTISLWGSGTYQNITWSGGTYYTPEGRFYVDTRYAEAAIAGVAVTGYEGRWAPKEGKHVLFTGTIDLDDGNDYSALDIGKTLDIIINTDKLVISTGLIIELSYEQNAGEHLMVNIVVEA